MQIDHATDYAFRRRANQISYRPTQGAYRQLGGQRRHSVHVPGWPSHIKCPATVDDRVFIEMPGPAVAYRRW